MIHDIVIIIWEAHAYDQKSLVMYKNTIGKGLIIYVEPMDMIIFVVSEVYTPFSPPGLFCSWWLVFG